MQSPSIWISTLSTCPWTHTIHTRLLTHQSYLLPRMPKLRSLCSRLCTQPRQSLAGWTRIWSLSWRCLHCSPSGRKSRSRLPWSLRRRPGLLSTRRKDGKGGNGSTTKPRPQRETPQRTQFLSIAISEIIKLIYKTIHFNKLLKGINISLLLKL